jgi:hypothetical protein
MESSDGMKRCCESYVRRAWLAGVLYCVVPTLAWFGGMFATYPYRDVYLLRLAVALLGGAVVAAIVNRFGAALWVAKHRSPSGPATVADGALIGAACGWGSALVPPLTGLIQTNHPMEARTFVIVAWLGAAAIGAVVGGVLAAVGRKHLDQQAPPAAGAGQ